MDTDIPEAEKRAWIAEIERQYRQARAAIYGNSTSSR